MAGARAVDVEAVATRRAELIEALFARIGVRIDLDLLVLALTHRSFAYENGGLPTNERLEFLGDAVLGLCITDALYTTHPDYTEGQLAKLRASIVNMNALAGVARGIGLGELLRLGKGEERTDGRNKASLLADAVEALIGAVYSQHGLETARALVLRLFDDLLTTVPTVGAGLDWKTSLQEVTATHDLGVPRYVLESEGPDHDKRFTAEVHVGTRVFPGGSGRSKKEAEQEVAEIAWRAIMSDQTGGGAGAGAANSIA